MSLPLWPHQARGLAELEPLMQPKSAVCVTSPTGGGKTRMMVELLERGLRTALYTNRKMLLDQTAGVLDAAGVRFGIRAAGHATDFTRAIQLCSIQTTDSRSLKKTKWPLHDAELVLIDEAHVNKEATVVEIIRRHHTHGAAVVGFTATPLNVGHVYDELVIAGVTSELRECGALVPAHTFAPDEPDTAKIKRTKSGEYTQGDVVKAIITHSILGRVIEHWRALNPEQLPTLLFAPGVKESLWFAEQLCAAGIPAAHIDGESVWIKGELHESDSWARDELRKHCESGEIKIVCNRFVLREGIDWPFVRHMIFATIFGALSSYIQSAGRGLRACPSVGKTRVTIQDHGGNWWRHGSINSDREWCLDRTDYIVGEMREARLREKKDLEPIHCPKCHAVRASGPVCKQCGYAHTQRSRMVVQHDGTLKEMRGDIFRPRCECKRHDIAELWRKYYFRAKNADMTFNQARGLFAYENNWQWPPKGLPLMPVSEVDWFRSVKDVPPSRLCDPARVPIARVGTMEVSR